MLQFAEGYFRSQHDSKKTIHPTSALDSTNLPKGLLRRVETAKELQKGDHVYQVVEYDVIGGLYLQLLLYYIVRNSNYMDRCSRTCLQSFRAESALHHLRMLTLDSSFKESTVLCSSHRGVRDEHSSAYGHHSQPRAPPRVCVLSVCNKWKRTVKVLMWRKEGLHWKCSRLPLLSGP